MAEFIFQPRKVPNYRPRTPRTPTPAPTPTPPPPSPAVVIAATVPGGERDVRVSENDEVKDKD